MEIINLDMTPSTVTPNAHAGQYDSARTVRFMLKNGGTPYTLAGTETITAEITRSDNTEVTVNVANTSSNYVDVVFDDTVCTVKGLYACELRLKDSDGFDIGSKNFALLVQRDPYDGAGVVVETVGPADICTFETTLPEPLQSVLVNVLATGGNGTPDNPIPINGYTEANITRCGVNLWDEQWELVNGRVTSKNYIRVEPSTRYFFYNTNLYDITMYDSAYTNLGHPTYGSRPNGFVFQTSANCVWIKFDLSTPYGSTYNHNVSVNYPETDRDYHPYTGNTYTIAFGQTVYGGVLDVTRGKLTVTHLYKVYDGSESWYTSGASGGEYRVSLAETLTNVKLPTDPDMVLACLCNMFTGKTASQTYQRTEGISWQSGSGIRIYASDYNTSNITPWKTLLTNTPLQVVYELETPFDIDLTPEVISAVVGENNVFAGCGQTTVKYLKAGA